MTFLWLTHPWCSVSIPTQKLHTSQTQQNQTGRIFFWCNSPHLLRMVLETDKNWSKGLRMMCYQNFLKHCGILVCWELNAPKLPPPLLCCSKSSRGSTILLKGWEIPWSTWREPWKVKLVWVLNLISWLLPLKIVIFLLVGLNLLLKLRRNSEVGWFTSATGSNSTINGPKLKNLQLCGFPVCIFLKPISLLWCRSPAGRNNGLWINRPSIQLWLSIEILTSARKNLNMDATSQGCTLKVLHGILRKEFWLVNCTFWFI